MVLSLEVGFTNGVEQAMVVFFLVAEAVGALIGTHHATAQGAAFIQRAGGVDLATVVIPTAGGTGEGYCADQRWDVCAPD